MPINIIGASRLHWEFLGVVCFCVKFQKGGDAHDMHILYREEGVHFENA